VQAGEVGLISSAGTVSWLALGVFLAVAVWTDLRARRVPNGLVVCGLLVALVVPYLLTESTVRVSPGLSAVGAWAAGLILGGLLLWPLYLRGAMGAGDVKLMAMAGAFLGPMLTWRAVLYACVAGGVLGVALLAFQRLRGQARPTQQAYAPAIAAGCLAAVVLHGRPVL
jgi:prepilin peptidase CpaA